MADKVVEQLVLAQTAERAAVDALARCRQGLAGLSEARPGLAQRMLNLGQSRVDTAASWVQVAREAVEASGGQTVAVQALEGAEAARAEAEALVEAADDEVAMMGADSMEEVLWICDACGRWVKPAEGSVLVDHSLIYDHQLDLANWEKRNPGPEYTAAQLLARPTPVSWQVLHHKCTRDDVNSYSIGVGQIRTAEEVLDFTLHLMGKAWLVHTDWEGFVRKHVFMQGPRGGV